MASMETELRVQATSIVNFLKGLRITAKLPRGIDVLDPYADPAVLELCNQFYHKYYNDTDSRILILGINPGRFGSGTTGISFTDPIKLEKYCGIRNELAKKPELSADFIYAMIDAYGGPRAFYSKYFVSAVSPLGFTSKGKNINYYDLPALEKAVTPFMVQSINQMITIGMSREKCFCIGGDKNLKALIRMNNIHNWFDEIIPLPHPRFIMQYRRKKMQEYIDLYLTALSS